MTPREAEIRRLEDLATRIKTEMASNERTRAKNNDRGPSYDQGLDEHLYAVNEKLNWSLIDVGKRLLAVQSDMDWEPPAPRPAATKAAPKARPWEIDASHLKKPSYPETGGKSVFDAAYAHFQDHHVAEMQDLLREHGVQPDTRVTYEGMSNIIGAAFGMIKFAEHRAKVLEDAVAALTERLAAVEASGLKYCGVHQKAMAYRKGSIVTFAGSGWIALKDVPEGVQPVDDNTYWQLAIKKGADGRDADPRRDKKDTGR